MKIESGKMKTAQRCVIYGPEGVGKSYLASKFPSPLFLDCEGGTKQLDVDRINITSINEVNEACAEVQRSDYKTLVIDTADWCESVMIRAMLRRDGMKSIEEYGYGKGYTEAQAEFQKLLSRLDTVINAGIHVLVLAHSQVCKFERPGEANSYDRYQLKLTRRSVPLLKEWADMVLFYDWEIRIAKDGQANKARGVGGKDRILHTEHCAAYDAKNRHQLPEAIKIPTGIRKFTSLPKSLEQAIAFDSAPAPAPGEVTGALVDKAKEILDATDDKTTLSPALDRFHSEIAKHGSEATLNGFLAYRKAIQPDETWRDITSQYATNAVSKKEAFLDLLIKWDAERSSS